MYRYSANPAHLRAFADKIAFCCHLNIFCMELDGYVDGVPFADMTPDQIEDARQMMILSGVCINLSALSCDPDDEDAVKAWLQTAYLLGVENVVLPAPAVEEEETAWAKRMNKVCAWAASYGMGLLLNCNDNGFLCDGDGTAKAERALRALAPFSVKVILDPYAYMSKGSSVFWRGFYGSRLKNAVAVVRANDGIAVGEGKLPGEGRSDVRELLSLLLSRSFSGYFSVAPYPGFADEEALAEVLKSLRRELSRM